MSLGDAQLLALLRLGSAALPIGAFAYSQGLEQAIASHAVHDAASAAAWIEGVLERSILSNDVPLLARLHRTLLAGDRAGTERLSAELLATRGTRELYDEELALGRAMARFLASLGYEEAADFIRAPRVTLASMFALAARDLGIEERPLCLAYGFAWLEGQVGAATRLIPLGQGDAQRLLSRTLRALEAGLDRALTCGDDEIAQTTPGQILCSMLHETQYSRLFRS